MLEHRNGGNMQSKAPKTSTWSAWSPPRLSKGHGTRWPLKKQKWLSCQCKWLSQDREKIQTFDQQKCVCFDVLLAVLIMIYESGFRDNMYLCLFLCLNPRYFENYILHQLSMTAGNRIVKISETLAHYYTSWQVIWSVCWSICLNWKPLAGQCPLLLSYWETHWKPSVLFIWILPKETLI